MEDIKTPEFAESIPFRRATIALVLDVSQRTLNNWIDRNDLWQTARNGYYRLGDVFDLAGLSAMRTAHIPERQCAQYVRNYGFYRGFLQSNQLVDFSYRNGDWDIGMYDPRSIVSLRINMRTIGGCVFNRLSEVLTNDPSDRAVEYFESFKRLYEHAIELDRLWPNSAPLFERDAA
jgi:hypothetical protein